MKQPCIIFFICLFIYSLTATWEGSPTPDAQAHALTAWTLANNSDWGIDATPYDNNIMRERIVGQYSGYFNDTENRLYSQYPPGIPLISAPVMLISGDLTSCLSEIKDPCMPAPNQTPMVALSVFMTALTVTLIHMIVNKLYAQDITIMTTILFGFGTLFWAVNADHMWVHTATCLYIVATIWFALNNKWQAAGWMGFLLVLTRPHTAIIGSVMALTESWKQKSIYPTLSFGIPTGLGVAAYIAFNGIVHKNWGIKGAQRSQFGEGINFIENFFNGFFTPIHGLLTAAFFILVTIIVFPFKFYSAPLLTRSTYVGGLLYICIQFYLHRSIPGTSLYGARYFSEMIAAMILPVAFLLNKFTLDNINIKTVFVLTTLFNLPLTLMVIF